jgi:pimeloyl-ACP methyl ester carboxylesterase
MKANLNTHSTGTSPQQTDAIASSERIVHAQSEDGFRFAGLLIEPARPSALIVIWVHGLHMNFSVPEYCEIGRQVAKAGTAFISVDTRGATFGAWIRGSAGNKLAGAAWEQFTECSLDLAGWLQMAAKLGYSQVVLAGHGYGASKAVFYIAERQPRAVSGLVIASSGSLVRDKLDPDQLSLAQRMADEGRAMDLMPWGTRRGTVQSTVSAQVYLGRARLHRELYGFGNLPPALSRVSCPILAWFGDQESSVDRDPRVFLDTITRNAVRCPSVQTRIIKGATYQYTGTEHVVAKEISRWVQSLQSGSLDTGRSVEAAA